MKLLGNNVASTLLRLRMQQMFQKDKIPSPGVILTGLKLQGLPDVHFVMATSGLRRLVLLPQTVTIPLYLRR